MEPTSLDDYRWLVAPQSADALSQAAELLAAKTNLVRCVQTLRKTFSPAQARLALETIELRQRAREKFSLAEQMFFTRTSLEQATDESIAAYKATRFPVGAFVADWCTGIGGDLQALAAERNWIGVDRDPMLQLLAAHNVAAMLKCDAADLSPKMRGEISIAELPVDGCWHLDPDRRADGKRTTRLEGFSPPLDFIDQVRQERPHGALKIAPASDIPDAWLPTVQREWISRGGECRQQIIWFGALVQQPGEHVATIVAGAERPVCHVRGVPRMELPIADRVEDFLHEPDASVIAAGLTGALAQQLGLAALAAGNLYLTSSLPVAHPAVASFRIVDQLHFDRKQLQSYFRERNVGILEIKKRGIDCQPEQLRKSLALRGDDAATLIVTRIGERAIALVAQRCV